MKNLNIYIIIAILGFLSLDMINNTQKEINDDNINKLILEIKTDINNQYLDKMKSNNKTIKNLNKTIKNLNKDMDSLNSTINKLKLDKQNLKTNILNTKKQTTQLNKQSSKQFNKQINETIQQSKISLKNKIKSIKFINKKQQLKTYMAERKKDILFLSRIQLRQKLINSFYHIHKTNSKYIYKEVSFFNLKGKEIYKKSSIETLMMNISNTKNTYGSKEQYFSKINDLQEGQVYVSKIVTYKNKSIIRLVTPIIRKFKKVGFLTVVVDYSHIKNIK